MFFFRGIVVVFLLLLQSSLLSAPIIEVDTQDVNWGPIKKATTEQLKHVFILKNKGDAPLHLTEVRPSCGCTAVEYDSVIAPGKQGKLLSVIKLSSLHDGDFTKTISVISNASNNQRLRLSLSGKILSAINVSDRYLHLTPKNGVIQATITLSTQKKDFEIQTLRFVPTQTVSTPGWQAEPAYVGKYTLTLKSSTPDSDGYYTFEMQLTFSMDPTQSISGNYVITTNHPQMAEISIYGLVMVDETKKKK
ncbi:MAG: DUF1573 domain-containing protein [Chitinivibrionales bacterium]|nr:DUF1573 domain-containing protein [Chitinivibrionales bacterium]